MVNLDRAMLQWLESLAPQGIFTTDDKLIIRSWNHWLATHSGRSATEMVGRHLLEAYPDLAARGLDKAYQQALNGQVTILAHRIHLYLLPMPPSGGCKHIAHMPQSARIAPLVEGDRIVGTITVIEDVTERVEREEELRRQITTLDTLREIGQAILTLDSSECLQQVARQTAALIHAPMVTVVMREGDTLCARVRFNVEEPSLSEAADENRCREEAAVPQDSVAGWVMQSGRPILLLDTDRTKTPSPLSPDARCVIAAPLIARDKVIGALVAESPDPNTFTEEDQALITAIAPQAAIAIHNAQLHDALRSREALFRAIIENTSDIIALADCNHILRYVSPSVRQVLGYEPDELVGQEATQLIHPEDVLRALESLSHVCRYSGLTQSVEVRARHKDGSWRVLAVRTSNWLDDPMISGVVLSARDITEHRKTEEEIRRWATHQQALNAIIAHATSTLNLQDLLRTTLDHVLQAFELKMGAAWIRRAAKMRGSVKGHPDALYVLRGLPREVGPAIACMLPSREPGDVKLLTIEDWQKPISEPCDALAPLLTRFGIRASLTVPIRVDGRSIGGLSIASSQPRVWSDEEIALAEMVGRQIGAAAERLWLLEETRAHVELMRRLADLSDALNRPHSMDEVLQAIGQGALTLSDADRAALYLRNPDDTMECAWSHGFASERGAQAITSARDLPEEWLTGRTAPVLIPETEKLPDTSSLRRLALAEGSKAIAVCPLVYEGRVIAVVVCCYNAPHFWSAAEQEVMEAFGGQAAVALENARLYASLHETNEQLKEALQAREEMIQNVSHELRTPLTLIRGYAELLQEGHLGTLAPQQAEAIHIIHKSAERLHLMVNRLLMLQALDASTFQKIELNPANWLQDILTVWQREAERARVDLQLDVPPDLPSILGDPELLGQTMDNLLDNAIKFSPEGGEVRVRAWQEDSEIIISVSDQGVGIPPDKLDKIFDRFYQVDGSMTRRFGGMGIGLALCREIVEKHGGRIWATSNGANRGSTFYIALPVAAQAVAA